MLFLLQETSGFPALAELFTVGSLVQCSILELEGAKPGQKKIKLSLDPKDVNSSLTKSSLKQGMVGRSDVINIELNAGEVYIRKNIKDTPKLLKLALRCGNIRLSHCPTHNMAILIVTRKCFK